MQLRTARTVIFGLLFSIADFAESPAQIAGPPKVTTLGTCTFASGKRLTNCRTAYRTFGPLNATRSNVILVPTFFAGRSEDHAFMLGSYLDTTRYHVIIVDALADGHSSSPSNVAPEMRVVFNDLTIRDMVEVQRRLLVEQLGILHLRAIVGISMGGFQAFEWAVRHPLFSDAVVSIVGSPRVTAYDQLVYHGLRTAAQRGRASGELADSAWTDVSRLETLFMRTPSAVNDSGPARAAADIAALAGAYRQQKWALEDYAAQLRAMARHDIAGNFGGDMARAAAAVRARMLVVHSADDLMVSAGPAAEFARLARADTLRLTSTCGHSVFWCEAARVGSVVRAFLERHAPSDATPAPAR